MSTSSDQTSGQQDKKDYKDHRHDKDCLSIYQNHEKEQSNFHLLLHFMISIHNKICKNSNNWMERKINLRTLRLKDILVEIE